MAPRRTGHVRVGEEEGGGRMDALCSKGDAGLCSMVTVVWGARRNEGRARKASGFGWAFVAQTAGGALGGIPDEWQSVWQANTAGLVGVLGIALESTVERAALDDPGP